jgi:hypothetical protein
LARFVGNGFGKGEDGGIDRHGWYYIDKHR